MSNLSKTFKVALNAASLIAVVGLVVGGFAGWLGLALADDPEKIVEIIIPVYLAMAIILPLALVLVTSEEEEEWGPAEGEGISLPLTYSLGGLFGALAASALFFIVSVNVPALFGGEDPVAMNLALRGEIAPIPLSAVVVITILTGLVTGVRQRTVS